MKIGVVGIDIGGTSVKSGLLISTGHNRWDNKTLRKLEVTPKTIDALKVVVFQLIQEAVKYAHGIGVTPKHVGISTSGTVSTNGIVADAHFYSDYNGTSWRTLISRQSTIQFEKVVVLNDGNAAAWAEYFVRNETEITNMIHLSIGTGVGGGIIIDNKILSGQTGAAAEVGHIVVVTDGRQCPCGKLGCVEGYSGAQGIAKTAIELVANGGKTQLKGNIGFSEVIDWASKNDRVALQAIKIAGKYLGSAAVSLVNVLNPGLLTLGGGVVDATVERFPNEDDNPYLVGFRTELYENGQSENLKSLIVRRSRFGNDAGWIGAGMYAASAEAL